MRPTAKTLREFYRVAADVIGWLRAGNGPALIEFATYRWTEHCGPQDDLHLGYRTKEELAAWQLRCPILLQGELLRKDGLMSDGEEKSLRDELSVEIDVAIAFAKSSPFPDRSELARGVYA